MCDFLAQAVVDFLQVGGSLRDADFKLFLGLVQFVKGFLSLPFGLGQCAGHVVDRQQKLVEFIVGMHDDFFVQFAAGDVVAAHNGRTDATHEARAEVFRKQQREHDGEQQGEQSGNAQIIEFILHLIGTHVDPEQVFTHAVFQWCVTGEEATPFVGCNALINRQAGKALHHCRRNLFVFLAGRRLFICFVGINDKKHTPALLAHDVQKSNVRVHALQGA